MEIILMVVLGILFCYISFCFGELHEMKMEKGINDEYIKNIREINEQYIQEIMPIEREIGRCEGRIELTDRYLEELKKIKEG